MRVNSFGLKAVAALSLSLAGLSQAASVTCPNAPVDRFVTVTGAKTGGLCAFKDGNFTGDNFSPWGLTLIEKDVHPASGIGTGGVGNLLYSANGAATAGSWTAAASQWGAYGNLYVAFHFGNGGGTPDSFIVQLDQSSTSGSWTLGAKTGGLNGLSNIYLLGSGTPTTTTIPEPGSLALVGLSLLGLALSRRRKA